MTAQTPGTSEQTGYDPDKAYNPADTAECARRLVVYACRTIFDEGRFTRVPKTRYQQPGYTADEIVFGQGLVSVTLLPLAQNGKLVNGPLGEDDISASTVLVTNPHNEQNRQPGHRTVINYRLASYAPEGGEHPRFRMGDRRLPERHLNMQDRNIGHQVLSAALQLYDGAGRVVVPLHMLNSGPRLSTPSLWTGSPGVTPSVATR